MSNERPALAVPEFRSPGGSGFGFGDMIDERLLRERIIWLEGEVRDDNSNRIAKQLQVLAADDPAKDITLYILKNIKALYTLSRLSLTLIHTRGAITAYLLLSPTHHISILSIPHQLYIAPLAQ